MAYALVQSKITGAIADGITVTYDAPPTLGNLCLAIVGNSQATAAPTVTDSGTTWELLASFATGRFLGIYGKVAPSSAPTAITADVGTNLLSMNLYEFSGGSPYAVPRVGISAGASVASASTTTGSQPSATPIHKGALLISSHMAYGGAITAVGITNGTTGTMVAGQSGPAGAIRQTDSYQLATIPGSVYNPSYSWTTARASVQLLATILGRDIGGF